MKYTKLLTVLLSAGLWISCDKDDDDDYPPHNQVKFTVVKGAGDLAAPLQEFRTLLGDPVNTTPNQTAGRREVNWDGVPANLTNNDAFPLDFFNNTDPNGPNGRKRGLVYVDNGAKFRIDSSAYIDILSTYANNFKAFSPKRLITAINTNISEAIFKVPGTNTDAFVRGFGLIFSDVDNDDYTTVEFFNGNKSLGKFKAPARNDANGHSFLGVYFPEEKVTRVKIVAGNGVLNGQKDITDGGDKDLVVFDDFFYNEPVAINN
jgi:hypothetical protein